MKRRLIPNQLQEPVCDLRESSRGSTIANGLILKIWTRLRSIKPRGFGAVKSRSLKSFGYIPFLLTAVALSTAAFSAEPTPSFGIVNFGTCVSDSKLGKQEQASFESLKKQMSTLLEDTEKQLNELAAKFNDPEYLDGLSPEAEEELKTKFRTLNEELSRYQNQYYQVMNQANMRIIQILSTSINTASEKVAKDKKLNMVVNKDACFYYTPVLDVTTSVITEMDKNFVQEAKKQADATETPAAEQKTEAKR